MLLGFISMVKKFSPLLLTALGFSLQLSDIHEIAKIIALLIPIGYTLWRWKRDIKNERRKN